MSLRTRMQRWLTERYRQVVRHQRQLECERQRAEAAQERSPVTLELLEKRELLSSLFVTIDYSFDTNGFFNLAQPDGQLRRDVLQAAADSIVSRLDDMFDTVTPGTVYNAGDPENEFQDELTFDHPGTGVEQVTIAVVAANEIKVYAGGRDLPGVTAGEGGPGGASGIAAFLDQAFARGEPGATGPDGSKTDFAPWGGSITFDTVIPWHFGLTTTGLDAGETDFYSVAQHEFGHLFGIGTADSYINLINFENGTFTGAAASAANGGPVQLADVGHWANGTMSNVDGVAQEAAMDPSLTVGTRKVFTELDFAGLDDIGYELNSGESFTADVGDVIIHSGNTATSGFVDIRFDVPAGVTEQLAAYNIQLDLSPTGSGVTFTGATAHPTNGVFGSKSPIVNVTANQLQISDNLAAPFQSTLVQDGSVLVRAFFNVAANTTGTFNINPSFFEFVDESGNVIANASATGGTITVNAAPATLFVTSFQETASGFVAEFSQAIDPVDLNLYFTHASPGFGPADVVLQGALGGTVRGSLMVSADAKAIEFVRTGGILPPDDYTVTFRSANNGFNTVADALLDGDANGAADDAFVKTFTVATPDPETVVVSIPDISRGYGQVMEIPNNAPGIPLAISRTAGIAGVTGMSLTVHFDPALLDITGFVSSVSGATVEFQIVAPGEATLSISDTSEFASSGTSLLVGHFEAHVPDDALYRSKQTIRLDDLLVLDDSPTPLEVRAIADRAMHVVAFFGDANGFQGYDGADSSLVKRVAAQLLTGFPFFKLTDPIVVGDVFANNELQGNDATIIQRTAAELVVQNTPIPELPNLPAQPTPALDPRLFIPQNLTGNPGDTITVPISIEVTEELGITLSSAGIVLTYDPALFTLSNPRRGDLLNGTDIAADFNTSTPGELIIIASSNQGTGTIPDGTIGDLYLFDLTINPNATGGSSAINLLQSLRGTTTALFDNIFFSPLLLIPAPTNANTDEVDGLITIIGDEPTVSISDAVVTEGNAGTTTLTFDVTLSSTSGSVVTVLATTADGTAVTAGVSASGGNDYVFSSETITFDPGETVKTFSVTVNSDATHEAIETMLVNLTSPTNATIDDGTATGTINDDDAQPTVFVDSISQAEGNAGPTAFNFTVRLSNPSSQTVTVTATTSDGSATTADSDYQSNTQTLNFAAGVTTQQFTVLVNGDGKFEPNETFVVNLTSPTNATILDGQANGNITNDDNLPTISINDVTLSEGNAGTTAFTFTVSLSNPSASPISVQFATADGSATLADNDYQSNTGTLNFAAGSSASQTITVLVNGDNRSEPSQTFLVNLFTATNAAIADTQGVGTIVNDDVADF
ncbi:MAG: Calx-beta domain-containing protein, partial [Phycisphaeraceae bacterium]